ncbi:MAG: ATP-binding protein [Alphaproteobacteria bacterium]
MRAIQLLPDAVLIVQREDATAPLRIVTSNAAAQDMLRIRAQDENLISVLRHPEILSAVEKSLSSGESCSVSCDTGGPQSRTLRIWTRPLPHAHRPSVVLILRDETDARRLERMRADFMANASHELRTPLASITGFIDTLLGHARDDADARNRFLPVMAAQAKRMSRLIDDLLSLSRIELNEHVPPSGTCDLALVVREVVDGLLPVVSAKGAKIDLAVPPESTAQVIGERDQLAQIIQNLIDNAVKYAPDGTAVTVNVCLDASFDADSDGSRLSDLREAGGGRMALVSPERAHENRYVQIRVSDCGAGIAREYLPRLTERFYRVPGQKSGEIPGTGLGLAIVKHIVNRHRGGLSVESAPGQGTTFTVLIPAPAPNTA